MLSVFVSLTRLPNFEAFVVFPKYGSMNRRLASLHWLQRGEVRQLQRYYQDAMTPCRHPVALRFLRLTVPRMHSLISLHSGRVQPPWPGVGSPVSPPGNSPRSETGFSQVPGEPLSVCTCSKPTPAGLLAPDHRVQQRGPWSSKGKGSHNWVFRRSIAWLSD